MAQRTRSVATLTRHELELRALAGHERQLGRAVRYLVDVVLHEATVNRDVIPAAWNCYSKLALLIGFAFVRPPVTFHTHDYTGNSGTRWQAAKHFSLD